MTAQLALCGCGECDRTDHDGDRAYWWHTYNHTRCPVLRRYAAQRHEEGRCGLREYLEGHSTADRAG